jgi:hypothetical protein
MFTLRIASAIAGLLVIGACGSPSSTTPVARSSSNPTASSNPVAQSPIPSPTAVPAATPAPIEPGPTAVPIPRKGVLVGYSDKDKVFYLIRPDGSTVASLSGISVVGEQPVGAFLVVASYGSSKGWTVDPAGVIKTVAPAAVKFLSPPESSTDPLIVDSSTAINITCTNSACTANKVDLRTGAVRRLLTVPQNIGMGLRPALTILDVTFDRKTVWLSKVSYSKTPSGQLEVVGIDLQTGAITSKGTVNALAGEEVAISPDGKSLAGQEEAGVNSTNLAIRHLHVVSLLTKADSDVQGTAPYVGGQRTPSVLFAPSGAAVAWWGGLDNGSRSFQVNLAPLRGQGKTLYNPVQADFSYSLSGVFWFDQTTLVAQNGLDTYRINTTTGAQTLVSHKISYLFGVIS